MNPREAVDWGKKASIRGRDRRSTPRSPGFFRGGDLNADVRVGPHPPYNAKVINLSENGILLEFSKTDLPRLRVDEPITVKLWLPQDVVWLPGIVRHCYAKRVGVFFPKGLGNTIPNSRQILNKMLRKRKPLELTPSVS